MFWFYYVWELVPLGIGLDWKVPSASSSARQGTNALVGTCEYVFLASKQWLTKTSGCFRGLAPTPVLRTRLWMLPWRSWPCAASAALRLTEGGRRCESWWAEQGCSEAACRHMGGGG